MSFGYEFILNIDLAALRQLSPRNHYVFSSLWILFLFYYYCEKVKGKAAGIKFFCAMENKDYHKVKRELQLIEEPRQSTRKKQQKTIKDEEVEETEDEQCCIEEIAYVNVNEEMNYTKLKEVMKTHIDQCTSMHRELLKEIKFLRAELKVYKKNTPNPEIRTINNTLTILDIPKCTEEEFEEFDNNLNIEEYEQALVR